MKKGRRQQGEVKTQDSEEKEEDFQAQWKRLVHFVAPQQRDRVYQHSARPKAENIFVPFFFHHRKCCFREKTNILGGPQCQFGSGSDILKCYFLRHHEEEVCDPIPKMRMEQKS